MRHGLAVDKVKWLLFVRIVTLSITILVETRPFTFAESAVGLPCDELNNKSPLQVRERVTITRWLRPLLAEQLGGRLAAPWASLLGGSSALSLAQRFRTDERNSHENDDGTGHDLRLAQRPRIWRHSACADFFSPVVHTD